MRILLLIAFLASCFFSYSQQGFSKEISIVSDNDLYTSAYRDRYYTNGLFIKYRILGSSKNQKIAKRTYSYSIGHMMYTPYKATLPFASLHDRPFAAYLFSSFEFNNFYYSQNIFKVELQLGVIGPNAKGEALQNFIHSIYNYPDAVGWKHQIHNAFALNLNATYLYNLTKLNSSHFDLNTISTAKLGTVFTNFSTGLYSRIGFKELQPLYNSVAFHSNLNKETKSYTESFAYIKPIITYANYDATIQGSFLNTDSPVTYEIKPIYFTLELGYRFYKRRFLYGYSYYFQTKKIKSTRVTNTNSYGSIYIGYYFN